MKLRGRVWLFGDLLDVDQDICPHDVVARLRSQGMPESEEQLGKYCLVNVDPDFPARVKKGDIIVAGENFGYGHDNDHACKAIRGAGVAAVICESTNTVFLRNATYHGLPVIACPGIKRKVKQGDELEIELAAGTILNTATGEVHRFAPLPHFLLEVVRAGDLYRHLGNQIKEGRVCWPAPVEPVRY